MSEQKKYNTVEEAREALRLLESDCKHAQKVLDRDMPECPELKMEMFDDEKLMEKYERKNDAWHKCFDDMMNAWGEAIDAWGDAEAIMKEYPELREEFKEFFS